MSHAQSGNDIGFALSASL